MAAECMPGDGRGATILGSKAEIVMPEVMETVLRAGSREMTAGEGSWETRETWGDLGGPGGTWGDLGGPGEPNRSVRAIDLASSGVSGLWGQFCLQLVATAPLFDEEG